MSKEIYHEARGKSRVSFPARGLSDPVATGVLARARHAADPKEPAIVHERAYAKINLGLKVLEGRPDGYHDILTVLQAVSLCDRLQLTETTGAIEVICTDPEVPSDERNLVYRAAVALRERLGVGRGARILLEKGIPTAAGLGGGSSDAAAALRGLVRLWHLRRETGALCDLATSLGCDVAFFLTGGTAIASGRGERLESVAWPEERFYVVVYPGFGVSTGWAYHLRRTGLTSHSEYVKFIGLLRQRPSLALGLYDVLENDLEAAVGARHPQIPQIKAALLQRGARAASMSGSGSSVYGVFDTQSIAQQAASTLAVGSHRVWVCSSLP